MAATSTAQPGPQRFLDRLMRMPSYYNKFWQKAIPSKLLRTSPTGTAYKEFLNVIKLGITDFQKAIGQQQALLTQRTWSVQFAVTYIAKLEAEDGGWGLNTKEIVEREQKLLPIMRRKVVAAETRGEHCKNLLAQFELLHRLVTSVQSRLKPDITDEDKEKMTKGLKLVDSEWIKLQNELVAANAYKIKDDDEKVEFFYRWVLESPDGTNEIKKADACQGPIVIGEDMAGYKVGEPIIGPDATNDPNASTLDASNSTVSDGTLDAASPPKKKKKKKKKAAKKKKVKKTIEEQAVTEETMPAPSRPAVFFAARPFADDSMLALNTETLRVFSHDHKRDYWGWGMRNRGMSF